jgi:hypothetical protein
VQVAENELTIYDPSLAVVAVYPLLQRRTARECSYLTEQEPPHNSQRRSEQLTQRFAELDTATT